MLTIAVTKIHNFILAMKGCKKIYLEQHLSYFEMVLMTLTAQSVSACLPALREHYSKKCTMFAKEIESLVLDTEQNSTDLLGGNIQIILLFSRSSGGQSDCAVVISMIIVNPMLFTLEVYSKTNLVNLNNKNLSNAWPRVIYSPQCARNEF